MLLLLLILLCLFMYILNYIHTFRIAIWPHGAAVSSVFVGISRKGLILQSIGRVSVDDQ